MKALVCKEFGPYAGHTVIETDAPKIKPGHVRLRIKAAGLNFPDILMVEGKYQVKPPLPFIAGAECAGEIIEIGDGVKGLAVGDRVAAMPQVGAFAEEVIVPAPMCAKISDKMSFEEAAGFMMVYATSYYALVDVAKLQAGEKLMVLGAAGGVGLAAVEIGKALGANVVACASTAEKLAVCAEHGADAGLNYSEEDIKTRGRELTGGGADVIYDPVGDKFAEPAVRALGWQGRYLVVGFAGGEIPRVKFNLFLLKEAQIKGVHWGAAVGRDPAMHVRNLAALMEMYDAGKLRPRISSAHKLENFASAFDELMNRRAMGKVVLTMG